MASIGNKIKEAAMKAAKDRMLSGRDPTGFRPFRALLFAQE
jgi:hypothetical protein